MRFVEVLCEGASDVPAVREILGRRFGLRPNDHFLVHPHAGKGKLPRGRAMRPPRETRGLLDQLPAKLRAYGRAESAGYETLVIVLVDADDDDCVALKRSLLAMYAALPHKPGHVLFRIAVEETESWFLADAKAVRKAFPDAKVSSLRKVEPDAVCGAWETLASALGKKPSQCVGRDKLEWASAISPHLDLTAPKSPSLRAFMTGLEKALRRAGISA